MAGDPLGILTKNKVNDPLGILKKKDSNESSNGSVAGESETPSIESEAIEEPTFDRDPAIEGFQQETDLFPDRLDTGVQQKMAGITETLFAKDPVYKNPRYQEMFIDKLTKKSMEIENLTGLPPITSYILRNVSNIFKGTIEAMLTPPVPYGTMGVWMKQVEEGEPNILGEWGDFVVHSMKATEADAKSTTKRAKEFATTPTLSPYELYEGLRDISIGTAKTGMDAMISVGSMTPGGASFIAGIEALKSVGVEQGVIDKAMSAATTAATELNLLNENSEEWEQQLASIFDLVIIGAGMRLSHKTMNALTKGKKLTPEQNKEVAVALKDMSKNDVKAALKHPDSKELSAQEKKILDVTEDMELVPPEVKPILGEKLNEAKQEMETLEEQFVQREVEAADRAVAKQLQKDITEASEGLSESGKEALKPAVEEIANELAPKVPHVVEYGGAEGSRFKIVDGEKKPITEATWKLETERMKELGAPIDKPIKTQHGTGGAETELFIEPKPKKDGTSKKEVQSKAEAKAEVKVESKEKVGVLEEVHTVAKENKVDIESKEFADKSEELTGKRHLDDMTEAELGKMKEFIEPVKNEVFDVGVIKAPSILQTVEGAKNVIINAKGAEEITEATLNRALKAYDSNPRISDGDIKLYRQAIKELQSEIQPEVEAKAEPSAVKETAGEKATPPVSEKIEVKPKPKTDASKTREKTQEDSAEKVSGEQGEAERIRVRDTPKDRVDPKEKIDAARAKTGAALERLAAKVGAIKRLTPEEKTSIMSDLKEAAEGIAEELGVRITEAYEKLKDKVDKALHPFIDELSLKKKEDLTTGKKDKSDYIKRRLKDLNDSKEFTEKASELGDYEVQSLALANKASDNLLKDFQNEFGAKEGLLESFEALKGVPEIMIGSLSSKLILKMQREGMNIEALEVLDWKQKKLHQAALTLTSAKSDASPEETVSRLFAGLDKAKDKALEEEFKEGVSYKQALEEIQKRLDEVEDAYNKLLEKGEIDAKDLPEPEIRGRTKRSQELKAQAKELRKEGINLLKKGLRKQREKTTMGLNIESDTIKGLSKILQSYILEFEGNVIQAFEKFKKDTVKEFDITAEQIDSFKSDLMSQSKETIADFKKDKQRQIVENMLKPDTKETLKETQARKDAAEKMVKDHSEGKDMSTDLAEVAGFEKITKADSKQILDLTEKFSEYSAEGKLELSHNAWVDLMTKLGDLKLISRFAHEVTYDIWYTGVLSGLSTLARSIKGSSTTAIMHTATRLIGSAKFAPFMVSQMIKGAVGGRLGIGKSVANYAHVLRTGQSNINITDFTPKLPKYTDTIWRRDFGELNTRDKIAKVVMMPVTFAYRNIIAYDQIIKNPIIESNMALFEMERTNKGKKMKQRLKEAARALASDKTQEIKDMVANEISAMKSNKEKIPWGYADRRFREIRDTFRDAELVKRAMYDASVAALVSTPKGVLGRAYNTWLNAVEIKKGEERLVQATKMGSKSLFPFMRVALNWINAGLDYTPIFGVYRSFKKETWTKDGYRDVLPHERRELRVRAALGTAIFGSVLTSMFDWDKDEGWKLDDDSWIKVYGPLTGKWWEQKDIRSDAKPWSFSVKNPTTGEWGSVYQYRDNPIGFALAPIGIMHDEIAFKDFKKGVTGHDKTNEDKDMAYLLAASAHGIFRYSMDQSFNQGMNAIGKVIGGTEHEAAGKQLGDMLYRPTEGFVPGLYKQLYNQYKAVKGTPEKQYREWYEKPARLLPFVDAIIKNNKYDVFGYPVVRDFDFPMIPDVILKMAKENLDYREGIREWELLHKYEEVTIGGFLPSEKLSSDDKDEFMRLVGQKMRSLVDENYSELNKMDAAELQAALSGYKRQANTAIKKVFGLQKKAKKKPTGIQENKLGGGTGIKANTGIPAK